MAKPTAMGTRWIETLVGAAVIAVATLFLFQLFGAGAVRTTSDDVVVYAMMNNADGLSPGTDVRMAGVKIGRVVGAELDPETLQARVNIALNPAAPVPIDSSLRVLISGLLGGNYLSVEPGGEVDVMKTGDQFKYTSDAVNLVDLIGQVLLGGGGN